MTSHYCLKYELPLAKEFDLDDWAATFNAAIVKLTKACSVWHMTNDHGMEIGTAFQHEHRIYIRWHYLSFRPRLCWFATQLTGELLYLKATISMAPCSLETFEGAHKSL